MSQTTEGRPRNYFESQEFTTYRLNHSSGLPCRVSLEDAIVGEELLLLPFVHQPAASPYRESGQIFIRRNSRQRVLAVGEISPYVTCRVVSVRAYDAKHMMIDASVCDGMLAGPEIERYFSGLDVAYIPLHNTKRGCF